MKPHNSIFVHVKLLLFILVGIGGVLFLVSQTRLPQEIRNWASTLLGVEFTIEGSNTTIDAGNTFEVPIFINTGTKSISSFKLVGEISGISATETSIQAIQNTQLNSILEETYEKDGKLYFQTIQLSSTTDIFSSQNTAKKIALLRFSPGTAKTITITLLATESQAIEYGKGVLSIDVPTLQTYTISFTQPQSSTNPTSSTSPSPDIKKDCNQNCATDTECKSEYICYQGHCRNSSIIEDDKCGSKPDMGIHRDCNEYCADSQECSDDYICYYNRCRIPQNLESESCQKPASPSPTPRVTYSPRTTTYASPLPSPIVLYSPIPSLTPSLSPSPSPFVSASGKNTPAPSSTKPLITPLPDNLKPENYNQKQPMSWGKVILAIVGSVGLIGILASAYFYWRNH